MQIAVFKPTIKRRDMNAVLNCLVNESIGSGEMSQTLVRQAAEYLGISAGFAFREYSRAIEQSIDALELQPGTSVIASPLAPAVYGHVFEAKAITPIFADVDGKSGCIDPRCVEALLEKNPSAIFIHHPLGYMPDISAVERSGIPIVEDISSSIGAYRGVRRSGSGGQFVLVGMEEDHIITAGGGALLLSRSSKDLNALKKITSDLPESFFLTDLNAALALTQINNIEEFIRKRKDIAQIYHKALMKGRHHTLLQDEEGENIFYSFPVLFEGSAKEAIKYARSKGIITKMAFSDSFFSLQQYADVDCPNAKALYMRCILFPLYPMLGKVNVNHVAKILATLP
jgi:perosamine synthetase